MFKTHGDTKQRFSFRKSSLGVASVLIASFFLGGGQVMADDFEPASPEVVQVSPGSETVSDQLAETATDAEAPEALATESKASDTAETSEVINADKPADIDLSTEKEGNPSENSETTVSASLAEPAASKPTAEETSEEADKGESISAIKPAELMASLATGSASRSAEGTVYFPTEEEKRSEVAVVPEGMTEIGERAFEGSSVKEVILPKTIKHIRSEAFQNSQLERINLPVGLETIGLRSFRGSKLTSIVIPEGVIELGAGSFSNAQLRSVSLPSTLKIIGNSTFSNNPLREVNLAKGIETIGPYFLANTSLPKLVIPEGVTEIENFAFNGSKLREVTLPTTLKRIGNSSFAFSSIEKITLPVNLEVVGSSAFYMSKLAQLIVPEGAEQFNYPTLVSDPPALLGLSSTSKVYLPRSLKSLNLLNRPLSSDARDRLKLEFHVYEGSPAHRYVQDNGLPYVLRQGDTIPEITDSNSDLINILDEDRPVEIENNPVTNKPVLSTRDIILKTAPNRDFSTITGDWQNAQGHRITITSDGKLLYQDSSETPVDLFNFNFGTELIDGFSNYGAVSLPNLERRFLVRHAAIGKDLSVKVNRRFSVRDLVQDWSSPIFSGTVESDISRERLVLGNESTVITKDMVYYRIGDRVIDGSSESSDETIYRPTDKEFQSDYVRIPEGVTAIADEAFKNSWIKEITLPSTLRKIGQYAFANTSNLTRIFIPEGVTEIGDYAFYGSPIREIILPSTLRKIGKGAFSKSQLGEIVIPEGIREISDETFAYSNLTKVTLPSTLKRIGENAFHSNAIKEVLLPVGLERIERSAFEKTDLTSLDLPEGIVEIGERAFAESKITELLIPESLKKIGVEAFKHVPLNRVRLSESFKVINDFILGTVPLEQLTISEGTVAIGQNALANTNINQVILPQTLKHIEANAFRNSKIKQLILPVGLETIGEGAFADTTHLTELVIPEGITELADGLFENSKIKSISLPSTLRKIGARAFAGSAIEQLILPANLEIIEESAFSGVRQLRELIIPNKVVQIGDEAFKDSGLTQVTLPSSLKVIGSRAFYNSFIERINLPVNPEAIGNQAFSSMKRLKELVVSEGVTEIGSAAFSGSPVREVHLPNSLKKIGSRAFSRTDHLSEVIIPDGVEDISEGAFSGSAIQSISLPATLKKIGAQAFSNTRLKHVDLPVGLEVIGGEAFSKTGQLVQMVIPEGVRVIGDSAFDLSGLKELLLPSTLESPLGEVLTSSLKRVVFAENFRAIARNELKNLREAEVYLPRNLQGLTLEGEIEHLKGQKLIFYVYNNSDAHRYLEGHKLPYKLLDGNDIVPSKPTGEEVVSETIITGVTNHFNSGNQDRKITIKSAVLKSGNHSYDLLKENIPKFPYSYRDVYNPNPFDTYHDSRKNSTISDSVHEFRVVFDNIENPERYFVSLGSGNDFLSLTYDTQKKAFVYSGNLYIIDTQIEKEQPLIINLHTIIDTDGDGLEDRFEATTEEIDYKKHWHVGERDLAIFASLAYQPFENYTDAQKGQTLDVLVSDSDGFVKNLNLKSTDSAFFKEWTFVDSANNRYAEVFGEAYFKKWMYGEIKTVNDLLKAYKIKKSFENFSNQWSNAALFVDQSGQQAVIAFRGTDGGEDELVWLNSRIGLNANDPDLNPYIGIAQKQVDHLLKSLDKEKIKNIYVTGHSLGGHLALQGGVHLARNDDYKKKLRLVANFNGPGFTHGIGNNMNISDESNYRVAVDAKNENGTAFVRRKVPAEFLSSGTISNLALIGEVPDDREIEYHKTIEGGGFAYDHTIEALFHALDQGYRTSKASYKFLSSFDIRRKNSTIIKSIEINNKGIANQPETARVFRDINSGIQVVVSHSESSGVVNVKVEKIQMDNRSAPAVLVNEDYDLFDIELIDQNGQPVDITEPAHVTLPIDDGKKVSTVFYLPKSGQLKELLFTPGVDANGRSVVRFTVNHFSHYGVVYEKINTDSSWSPQATLPSNPTYTAGQQGYVFASPSATAQARPAFGASLLPQTGSAEVTSAIFSVLGLISLAGASYGLRSRQEEN